MRSEKAGRESRERDREKKRRKGAMLQFSTQFAAIGQKTRSKARPRPTVDTRAKFLKKGHPKPK